MVTRRRAVVALGIALCSAVGGRGSVAAEASSTAFVTAIYNSYKGKSSKGVALDDEAAIRRYFEPSLAGLILKDREAAAKDNDVPSLDFDPFIDAQDWDITGFQVTVRDIAPQKATATATFKNTGKSVKVTLDLVKLDAGWRIRDIHWSSREGTLRKLYATP